MLEYIIFICSVDDFWHYKCHQAKTSIAHNYATFLLREHNEFCVNIYIEQFIIYFSFAWKAKLQSFGPIEWKKLYYCQAHIHFPNLTSWGLPVGTSALMMDNGEKISSGSVARTLDSIWNPHLWIRLPHCQLCTRISEMPSFKLFVSSVNKWHWIGPLSSSKMALYWLILYTRDLFKTSKAS